MCVCVCVCVCIYIYNLFLIVFLLTSYFAYVYITQPFHDGQYLNVRSIFMWSTVGLSFKISFSPTRYHAKLKKSIYNTIYQ